MVAGEFDSDIIEKYFSVKKLCIIAKFFCYVHILSLKKKMGILYGIIMEKAEEYFPGGLFHRPRCAHMGCELEWNQDERSWDCPCHGSRYDEDGKLLDNPAKKCIKVK